MRLATFESYGTPIIDMVATVFKVVSAMQQIAGAAGVSGNFDLQTQRVGVTGKAVGM